MAHANTEIRYVEHKAGAGVAWIARVRLSKTGRTVYFADKALKRGHGIAGNHLDLVTRDEYWVSRVKRDGLDRHWAEGGDVFIERSAVGAYLAETGRSELPKHVKLAEDLPSPDPSRFVGLENPQRTPAVDPARRASRDAGFGRPSDDCVPCVNLAHGEIRKVKK